MKKEKSMSKIWTKLLSYVPLSNRKGLNIDPIEERVHSEIKMSSIMRSTILIMPIRAANSLGITLSQAKYWSRK